ncbi:MAG: hypothetical protein PF693_14485 [Spirochaetia bacterium]|jgi:hypothetical protein|nr:hypothetical protein [Spirochaetia bacterium]
MIESDLIREVSSYIKVKGYFIHRTNTGRRGGVSYGTKGSGDFTGLLPSGRYIAIECKGDNGKQSEDQILFQTEVEKNNGLYILAYSLAEVKKEL